MAAITEYEIDSGKKPNGNGRLSNLNPLATEFIPSSYSVDGRKPNGNGRLSADAPVFDYYNAVAANGSWDDSTNCDGSKTYHRRRSNGYDHGLKRFNDRRSKAEKEACIRKTVYVSDIDQSVTEETLATIFGNMFGEVHDCRVCGDPKSDLRFAFIEFTYESGARAALAIGSFMLGFYPLRILPSKTAIVPVKESFLPQGRVEKERCRRTIYCTNIDKTVTQKGVKDFFESCCGEVRHLKLLGDHLHSTRIAFVEFSKDTGAIAALGCSGVVLGSHPIRVSPSKTPLKSCIPHGMA